MPINKLQNQTFTGQTFKVEECWFVNCILRECVLFYAGGPFDFENTSFENCQWKFQESARNVVQLLSLIGLIRPGQTPPPQIQATGGAVN